MPLIWNDDEIKLIDALEDMPSQFVIVTKIFIKFKANAENKDEEWIRKAFQKTGVIQSVEVFEESDHTWAYVTYANSEDANCALTDASKLEEIELAVPADTWSQPIPLLSKEPDAETLVAELNRFETAQISGQGQTDGLLSARELIITAKKSMAPSVTEALNRVLPLVQSFEFQLTDENGTAMSLNDVRSILQCIGPHISELSIKFRMDKYPKYVDRYYQKICQYVGPQLKTLKLFGVPSYHDWVVALKPLLGRIECFTLRTICHDFEYDIDFELHCPNVKELNISMNLNGKLLSKKQPKLEKFSMLDNQYMTESLVHEFLKNNPQLLDLTIQANDCNNCLKQIGEGLPKLEHLCLHQGYPGITADNLVHLTGIKNLKSLGLMYLDDEDDFNGILNCLPQFRQLEALQLHLMYDGPDDIDLEYVLEPEFDFVTTLAQELTQLKCFRLHYCQIDADTLQDFARYAKKLEIFTLRGCGLEITDEILEGIETVRQAEGAATMVLYADTIDPELSKEIIYSTVKLVPFDLYKP